MQSPGSEREEAVGSAARPVSPQTIGPYRLEKQLGAGGMGEVFRAYDVRLDRKVALKHIRPDLVSTPSARRRFLREARTAARLNHPALVQIYDIVENRENDYWIVMELVEGGTLAGRLESGPLETSRAVLLGLDLVDGLKAVHDAGIVHRDLKPRNVIFTAEGRAKILDFGLAKELWGGASELSITGEGGVLGTPRYMSPEQGQGWEVDHRSDLFALGITLYEMLTGEAPFLGATPMETIAKICTVGHVAVHDLVPEVPAELSELVDLLLEKDPCHRPQSTEDVCFALRAIVRSLDLPLDAGDVGAGREAGRPGLSAVRNASDAETFAAEPTVSAMSIEPSATTAAPAEVPADAEDLSLLRSWAPPEWPASPYPVLLPVSHPALLAGRRWELGLLRRLLRQTVPILGLHAPSGAGKSSLLLGGLAPDLRADRFPVALDRYPQEPGLASRLAGDLLHLDVLTEAGSATAEIDPFRFVEWIVRARRLARRPPILVLDQIENLFRDSEESAAGRAALGLLLAASAQRHPEFADPPCRWLLAYRQEFHGELMAWLANVLGDAEGRGMEARRDFPTDLSGPERFHDFPLLPLGTPPPGSDSGSALEAFREAIEGPLAVTLPDGRPRYPWRFAGDGAERLAAAFATARGRQPDAPLTPELQVVLAYLMADAGSPGEVSQPIGSTTLIEVPDQPDQLLRRALEDHLRRALTDLFPTEDAGARADRARALLVLRELAEVTLRGRTGISAADLTRALGSRGTEILDRLATPRTRLIVSRQQRDGWYFALAHDQMAGAVVRVVDQPGADGLQVDEEVLALRRFVALNTALHQAQHGQPATRLPRGYHRKIQRHSDALLWEEERRTWWAACQDRRRRDRRRRSLQAVGIGCLVAVLLAVGWTQAGRSQRRQDLLDQISEGKPEAALIALRAMADKEDHGLLREKIMARGEPREVFEHGAGGLSREQLRSALLPAMEIALPAFSDSGSETLTNLGVMAWALDYFLGRDPQLADQAGRVRQEIRDALSRRAVSPSPSADSGSAWVDVPGGTFWMGTGPGEGWDHGDYAAERPQHQVSISPFKIMPHEVTNAEFRRLDPDRPGEDDRPVVRVSWYEAYAYAVWIGGRLPTEAEWEYAARAQCPYPYCRRTGERATLDEVGWYQGNSVDPSTGKPSLRPVRRLEPNPWGLYDMYGNAWEWAVDWYAPYLAAEAEDPWGPEDGEWRVVRGGGYLFDADWTRAAYRDEGDPTLQVPFLGFRVVLDVVPEGRPEAGP